MAAAPIENAMFARGLRRGRRFAAAWFKRTDVNTSLISRLTCGKGKGRTSCDLLQLQTLASSNAGAKLSHCPQLLCQSPSVKSKAREYRARARPEDEFIFEGKDSEIIKKFGFPYSNDFCEKQFGCSAEKVVELLEPFMVEDRSERLTKIVEDRIFDIVPVVEGLYDLGNIAAVCRTVEGLGIGTIHIITGDGKYKQSARTTQGSHKWLQSQRWESTKDCLSTAKSDGYKVVVTDLEAAVSLDEIDWTQKTLLLFGNEHAGVSEEAKELADQRVMIPMFGFVESFNISVAAAMALKHAADAREAKLGRRGDLTAKEQKILQSIYYAKHLGARANDMVQSLLERERNAVSK